MTIIGVPWPGWRAERRSPTAWYCVWLMAVLAGYVFIGKGFAYQGVPPLFVGEITLLLGAAALLATGRIFETLASASAMLLAALMAWVVLRTLPYMGIYGTDAPRDAIIVLYGAFAFVVIGLLLEDRRRLNGFLSMYAFAAAVFVIASPAMFLITRFGEDFIPTFAAPSGEPILWWSFRPGQFGVHLAGAGLFAFLGLQPVTWLWLPAFIATAVMASATSRGAMLAIVVPIMLAAVLSGRMRFLLKIGAFGVVALGLALAIETALFEYRDVDTLSSFDRPVGVRQALAGLLSIFDQSGVQLSQTKEWRLRWWEIIQDHTLKGPYFWTGKGFGINLADADGFQQPAHAGAPPLRDPHSVHLTMLARAGVPGLALWLGTLLAWTWLLLGSMLHARRRGEGKWADVLLFIYGYGLAVVIESSFDIGLAGPMMGIPFWCLFGLGIAAATIYRTQVAASNGPGRVRF